MKTLLHCCALALGLAAAAAPARAQSTDWLWTTSMGWPGQFGPSQTVIGTRLAATADGGALVSVTFVGSVNFGGRRDTLVSLGNADAAVVKYSAAGTKLWTARIGGLAEDAIAGMGTDAQGNVYVTGTHQGTVYFFTQAGDFLPGAGAFLAKYTAAGVLVQAVSVGQSRVVPVHLLVAPSGACTIVGGFSGAVTVGSFSLVSVGNYTNAFVAQFLGSPAMNLIDAKREGAQFVGAGFTLPAVGEASGEVKLGLRPQDLRVARDGPLRGEIEAVERLGFEA